MPDLCIQQKQRPKNQGPSLETSLTICPRLDPSKLTWCLNKIDLCRLLSCLDARKRRTMTICPETNLGGCMCVCRAYAIGDRFTGRGTERAPCEKKDLCTYICTIPFLCFFQSFLRICVYACIPFSVVCLGTININMAHWCKHRKCNRINFVPLLICTM